MTFFYFMTVCPQVGWVVGIESLRNQTKRKVSIWVKFKERLLFGVGVNIYVKKFSFLKIKINYNMR